jgi:hypothetical protein
MDSALHPMRTPSCPGKTFRIYNIQEVLASFPAHRSESTGVNFAKSRKSTELFLHSYKKIISQYIMFKSVVQRYHHMDSAIDMVILSVTAVGIGISGTTHTARSKQRGEDSS